MPLVFNAAEQLSKGGRYEDRYGGWLKFFESIAREPPDVPVRVEGAPYSWVPLLWYLRADVMYPNVRFDTCETVRLALDAYKNVALKSKSPSMGWRILPRHHTEVLCSFRPETVDALWKVDAQWRPHRALSTMFNDREFPVTCNGSFWRPEVLHFIEKVLPAYKPTKRKVVLVPCAADKPYPSPMHQAVLDRLPNDYYLMNATGVLGLVPQDLWPSMPHYDSGIPNEWRLQTIVENYFSSHEHDVIIPYVDHYSIPISNGLMRSGTLAKYEFVNRLQRYDDYIDLLDPARLERLSEVIAKLG